jgi:hypothetical protein
MQNKCREDICSGVFSKLSAQAKFEAMKRKTLIYQAWDKSG